MPRLADAGYFAGAAAGAGVQSAQVVSQLRTRSLQQQKAGQEEAIKNATAALKLVETQFGPESPQANRLRLQLIRMQVEPDILGEIVPKLKSPTLERRPQPGEFIPRSASPLRESVKRFEGMKPFQTRQRTEEKTQSRYEERLVTQDRERVRGQAKAEIASQKLILKQRSDARKAEEKAAKPPQGLRDQYKSVGKQMVKKAEEIAGLRRLVPGVDKGTFGIGGNQRQVDLAQRNVAIAEEEMAQLQKRYDNLKNYAGTNDKTLEPNEWDVYRAGNLPAGGNLAGQPTVKPLDKMSEEELLKILKAGI